MKVLFIAGPPASGKDSIAEIINRKFHNSISRGAFLHEKFAAPLRDAICGLLDVSDDELEHIKRNDPHIRQLMIGLSELVVKPTLGKGYLGTSCAERCAQADYGGRFSGNVVITDAGFVYEVEAFMYRLNELYHGQEHEFLMWHLERPGHTFKADSRSWPVVDGLPIIGIHNGSSLQKLEELVGIEAARFFNE